MPAVTLELSSKRIKDLVFQLPPKDFMLLAAAMEERAETIAMMRLAESAFREWDEPGEDIYDETQAR